MSQREPIAIVGVTALFPGSQDNAGFWQDIVAGRDLIGDVPPHYWLVADYYDPDPAAVDKTYGKRGAFLTPVPFDALEFGIPPAALPATDSAQLLALIGAKRVLADAAGGRTNHVPRERVSVFLGVAATTATAMNMAGRLQRPAWVKGLRESGLPESFVQAACDRIATNFIPLQENTFPGILGNVVAGRIANRFDLGGSNFTLDAACASSLAALSVAINDLHLGNSDMAISGGVDALNDIQMFMCFSKTPALSPSGDCRPFSDKADGTMLGEGLSLFALRRLSDAERDGDQIYAVIRGVGSSSDGRAKSVYAPRSQGQAVALRRAYEAAGYAPDTVELMEAHGTGTPAGDAAEFESLRTVFEETGRSDRQWCALGSVKSQLGHTKGAAGAAGLFKVAMALHHKVLPPTIKVEKPNPKLDIENSPFYLNTEAKPWIRNDAHPRRASLSSFGFGGTNFHVALEEYTGPAPRPDALVASPGELFLLAEADERTLAGECRRVPTRLKDALDWRRLARDSQKMFDHGRRLRLALVVSSEEDLRKKLEQAALLVEQGTERVWHSSGMYLSRSSNAAPIAFLFSGQGSQYVGMGKDLAISFSWAREAWDLAEEALSPDGLPLRRIVFPKPAFSDTEREADAALLTRTENAQPALAAAGLAHLATMEALGVRPQFVAGHSFGELVALHAAGVIDARALLRIARKRGEFMAAAAGTPGTMTAVSCAVDNLKALLQEWQSDVVIANHNSPSQAVLSGSVESIQKVEGQLSAASITYLRLPVSAAFHSPLIADSIAPFAQFLEEVPFSSPKITVLSNSDAAPYGTEPPEIRQKLGRHLGEPVRFAEQIDALCQRGVRCFVELGSGSVLTGLVEKCLQGKEHVALSLERKGMNGVLSLWHALGQLVVERVGIDFARLWPAFAPIGEPQPSAKSSSTFLIDGAGYGRPYPPPGGTAALPKPNPEVVATPPVAACVPNQPRAAETQPAFGEKLEATRPELPIRGQSEFGSPRAPSVRTNTLGMFQEIQAQITAAQKATQDAILESHALTLKSLEALSREMSGQAGFQEPRTSPVVSSSLVTPPPQREEQPMAAQRRTPGPAQVMVPPPGRTDVMSAAPARAQMPPAPPATAAGNEAQDVEQLLLQVVSEKTGYPIDVLSLDTELESGLGIDSIKRVEIFSAVQQRSTSLPEVKPQDMASLRTLREIVAFLRRPIAGAGVGQAVPKIVPASVAAPQPTAAIRQLLLEVVAEKTGYPVDVLNVDTDLESGLGIDSIKRVEIFSAIQQRTVDLPEVKPQDSHCLPGASRAFRTNPRPAASRYTLGASPRHC
jgi:polyketide-type polyunsaturated fatty acid synthase PfaA